MKIGIICSSGGHLVEALHVLPAFKGNDLFLITYNHSALLNFVHPDIRKTYFIKFLGATKIMLICNMIVTFFHTTYIFLKEKPKLIFSTGSEIALPAFYIGKYIFGVRLIFLESITRVDELSYTGKLVYALSDLFLVQWPNLSRKLGKKAVYKGSVL
jgi:UDP-N-acetylglucosamine:LPS N-acetylglucosamine transferase